MSTNGALLEAFRHNNWATLALLGFSRSLSPDQLGSAATGTYGDILATFNHIIRADARYLFRLAGDAPAWATGPEEAVGLSELGSRAAEIGPLWEKLFSDPFDADRLLILDDGAYEANAGVIVAQALHHANAHREQICSILTGLGIEPPDIQGWAWGEATGRGRERSAKT